FEPELPSSNEPSDDLGQPLLLPQPRENECWTPHLRRMRLQPFRADLLDHAKLVAELRERAQQIVDGAVRAKLIEASEVEQHVLSNLAAVALRLDELKVLIGPAALDATFHAEEHSPPIPSLVDRSKKIVRDLARGFALHFDPAIGSIEINFARFLPC